MCRICEPILGRGGVPHTEAECKLKKASQCPVCGPRTHFPAQCPKAPKKRLPDSEAAIPSVGPKEEEVYPMMIMADTQEGQIEFLVSKGLGKKIDLERQTLSQNRDAVQEQLGSIESPLLLQNYPTAAERDIVILPVTKTVCKQEHGNNHFCIAEAPKSQAKQIILPKKKNAVTA